MYFAYLVLEEKEWFITHEKDATRDGVIYAIARSNTEQHATDALVFKYTAIFKNNKVVKPIAKIGVLRLVARK